MLKYTFATHSFKHFNTIIFVLNFYASSMRGKQKILQLVHRHLGSIYLRTKTADLEVVIQHLVYHEIEPAGLFDGNAGLILDAGANIGMTSRILSAQFPDALILAIEADSSNAEIFRKNCADLISQGKVELRESVFYPERVPNMCFVKSEDKWKSHVVILDEPTTEELSVITWEEVMAGYGRPDIIKMDIEGSEVAFLKSSEVASQLVGITLLVELHTIEAYIAYFTIIGQHRNELGISRMGEFWVSQPVKA